MNILQQIEDLTAGFSGTFGLWARSLDTGETIALREHESFHPASTIKVAILYELFRQALAGKVELGAPLTVRPEDQIGGAGVLKDLDPGFDLSVLNLATLMIVISDNTATNMIIDLVGRENVNASMAELGLTGIHLHNKMMLPKPGGPYNQGTPADLGRLMELIARRQVLTPDACDQILGIMKKQHFKDHITRALPEADAYPTDPAQLPFTVASKSGEVTGARNEVAAVWADGRGYVICMMSKGCADSRYYPDNEGSLLLPQVARAVHRHFIPAGPALPGAQ